MAANDSPSLAELASGLFWASGDLVLVVWAYVDESGRHDQRDRYTYLAVGGAIGELQDWDRLASEWRRVLDDENILTFHMYDCEHSKGEFLGWTKARREPFLRRLLDLILNNRVLACMAATTNAPEKQEGQWLSPVYKSSVTGLTARLIREVDKRVATGAPIHMVFSQHEEIAITDLIEWIKAAVVAAPERITVTTARPRTVLPLQVADLVVFESLRWSHDPTRDPERPKRYPLRYLKEAGLPILLDYRLRV